MTGFVMFIHAVISILLILVILMQAGRGGGLTEGFAAAEQMFGARTNELMIKATTVLGTAFLVTSLGLAILSSQKGKSLMTGAAVPDVATVPPADEPAAETPAPAAATPVMISEPVVIEPGAPATGEPAGPAAEAGPEESAPNAADLQAGDVQAPAPAVDVTQDQQ
jgi:preprotein translocase subunit SecG